MAQATVAQPTPSAPVRRLPGAGAVLGSILLGVIGFLVLYPILLLALFSFQVGDFGQATTLGTDNWSTALSHRRMVDAIGNTISLTVVRQLIALVAGVFLAWLIARTNLPGRNWLEFGFWISVFLPNLTVLLGWIVLFDGHSGLVNRALMTLPFIREAPFEIFSWWGIIFAHVMMGTVAVKVMLLTPAFRNLNSALEEASLASGAGTLRTIWRIVVPIMAPAVFVVMLLGTIRSLEAFEVELILGGKDNINVYSTLIYRLALQEPPQYGQASALSMLILLLIVPFVLLYQWSIRNRSYATISGKFSTRLHDLGRWRWPLFAVVLTIVLLMTVLPLILVVLGSFMSVFGHFNIANPWTLDHWRANLTHPSLLDALRNTMIIGVGSSILAMALFSLLAYISTRTKFGGRGALDLLTWLPTGIPGIVSGLGLLWLVLGTPFLRPFYGTAGVLIIAVVLAGITLGVQLIKSNLMQLGAELEEASWASGASRLQTFWKVILPLIIRPVALVGILTFARAVSVTSSVALLTTGATRPLSILQLEYLGSGNFERASTTGVIILALTLVAALLAYVVGHRAGLGQQA